MTDHWTHIYPNNGADVCIGEENGQAVFAVYDYGHKPGEEPTRVAVDLIIRWARDHRPDLLGVGAFACTGPRFRAVEEWCSYDCGGVTIHEIDANTIEEATRTAEALWSSENATVSMHVYEVVTESKVDEKAATARCEAERKAKQTAEYVADKRAQAAKLQAEIEQLEAMAGKSVSTGVK